LIALFSLALGAVDGIYLLVPAYLITEVGIDPAAANIIFGAVINENYNGEMKITVIATGFSEEPKKKPGHASLMRQAFGTGEKEDPENDLETPAFMRKKMR